MENVIVVGDFLGGCFPGFRVGGGFRAVACLYFFPQGKGILLFKQGLYFCLCFRSGVVMQLCGQIRSRFKRVMPDFV
jgi:membrane-associated PAP2 superfamily phosphatase